MPTSAPPLLLLFPTPGRHLALIEETEPTHLSISIPSHPKIGTVPTLLTAFLLRIPPPLPIRLPPLLLHPSTNTLPGILRITQERSCQPPFAYPLESQPQSIHPIRAAPTIISPKTTTRTTASCPRVCQLSFSTCQPPLLHTTSPSSASSERSSTTILHAPSHPSDRKWQLRPAIPVANRSDLRPPASPTSGYLLRSPTCRIHATLFPLAEEALAIYSHPYHS